MTVAEQMAVIKRGTVEILVEKELEEKNGITMTVSSGGKSNATTQGTDTQPSGAVGDATQGNGNG